MDLDRGLRMTTEPLQIVAYGLPAPQGSKRFVGLSKAGRGLMVESSAKVKPWREAVKHAALAMLQARGSPPPMDGPLQVTMAFTLPKPKSAPKRRRTWPDRTPDLSKLIRATEDALTDAGVWADDARVVQLVATKNYPTEGVRALHCPGVWVRVEGVV
jgi:crossover junction endodeoxyribonuclease RusA